MAGAFEWSTSLALEPMRTKGFYSTIATSTLISVAHCFTVIDPIKALYWSAVINGVFLAPIMALMLLMASRAEIMGNFTLNPALKLMKCLCAGVMAVAVIAMFWTIGT